MEVTAVTWLKEGVVLSNRTADPLVVLVTVVTGLPRVSVKAMLRLTDPSVSLSLMV